MKEFLVKKLKMRVLGPKNCKSKPYPKIALREIVSPFLEQRSCQEAWNPEVILTGITKFSTKTYVPKKNLDHEKIVFKH